MILMQFQLHVADSWSTKRSKSPWAFAIEGNMTTLCLITNLLGPVIASHSSSIHVNTMVAPLQKHCITIKWNFSVLCTPFSLRCMRNRFGADLRCLRGC